MTFHRSTLFTVVAFVIVAFTAFSPPARAAEDDDSATPKKTKILLIGHKLDHPWGSHMYLHTLGVLGKALELTEGVETVVADRWPKNADDLKGVKTIVVYSSPAAEMLLDGPNAEAFDELMKNGVGLVTIHWASSIHKKNVDRIGEKWMSYLGGTWVSNVGLSTDKSALKQLDPKHPICRGWNEYELHDEFYLNPTIKKAKPLLQVTTKGQDVIVGWAYERPDGGRAYGTTLGHFYRNFQIKPFRQALINAILWTAHVEVPKQGAPCDLSDDDLRLPAKPKQP